MRRWSDGRCRMAPPLPFFGGSGHGAGHVRCAGPIRMNANARICRVGTAGSRVVAACPRWHTNPASVKRGAGSKHSRKRRSITPPLGLSAVTIDGVHPLSSGFGLPTHRVGAVNLVQTWDTMMLGDLHLPRPPTLCIFADEVALVLLVKPIGLVLDALHLTVNE